MSSPEQLQNGEQGVDLRETAKAQLDKLTDKPESAVELSPKDNEANTEKARKDAMESAVSVEAGGKEKEKPKDAQSPPRRGPIDKKTQEKSYKQTMSRVRSDLPVGSRSFSKLIHNKTVEKTSEVLASTVARPNAILAGAATAFILTLIAYTVAKTLGYGLSGSETIAAFIIGWVLGLIYDYFRLMITGHKS